MKKYMSVDDDDDQGGEDGLDEFEADVHRVADEAL